MIKKRWVKPCRSPPACCLSPLCPGAVLAWRCRCSQEESESSPRAAPGFELHLKPGEALLSPLPTSQGNQPTRLGLDFTTSSGSLISIAALIAPQDCLLLHLRWFSWSLGSCGWDERWILFFLYAAFLSDSLPRDLSGGQPPSRPGFANRLILKPGCSWLTSMWTGRGKMMLSPTAWEEDKERSTHADAPCVTCSSCSWHETQRGLCTEAAVGQSRAGAGLRSWSPRPGLFRRGTRQSPAPGPVHATRSSLSPSEYSFYK